MVLTQLIERTTLNHADVYLSVTTLFVCFQNKKKCINMVIIITVKINYRHLMGSNTHVLRTRSFSYVQCILSQP